MSPAIDWALYRMLLRMVVAAIPKAIGLLWPFIIALFVAALINPVITKINKRLRVSRKVVAVTLDLLVFLAFSA